MEKTYEPGRYEARIYERWEKSGAFQPSGKGEPFSIIMPPPNANGDLHLGHAMYVVEDILTRYHRMKGDRTLWLPGADHAGIETQVVYERQLAKDGKSRFDLGRDEFYRQVDAFTKQNMGSMVAQLKSLGFSADWTRLKYTLDEDIVATVNDTFKRLHDDGYIYRANRIVNWCPYCHSAFADIEIKYREQIDPLYYIKYGPFVLATVRPETKFGDTAIAVNPKDDRYKKYVGQTIEAEDLNGPIKLQVIADSYVNPDFGTGVVKVTPAHDPNDWEMGLRHNLEVRQAIGTDGRLTELTGRYAGLPVDQARQQVPHDLEERGLIDHIDMNYSHSVAVHDRCGTPIEPLVIEQWWLKVDELKKPVIKAIKDGGVAFVPSRFKKVALDWMENLRDWNISRQNWWGIRIPVYYNAGGDTSLPDYVIGTEEEAIKTYGKSGYEAETDNFDTWFSSGQWPFATLTATGDMDFYPTSVMETGRDILFLWVTRMIMFGLYREGQVPFRTVYLHGLVTDGSGKKMSKSKGNVVNPLDMTAKYGTDALRLALTIGITPGNDGALSEAKIEGYRNFCNKLWNVARFIQGQLPAGYSPTRPEPKTPADAWILARINQAGGEVTRHIENYRFSEAGQTVYSLLWDDFADWYVEATKVEQNPNILYHGLTTILKLVHPFAPFVSEAIWAQLPGREGQLITAEWPQAVKSPAGLLEQAGEFDQVKAVIAAARAVMTEEKLALPTILTTSKVVAGSADLIRKLARVGQVELVKTGQGIYLGTAAPAWIAADEAGVAKRRHHLQADRDARQKYADGLDRQLSNKQFISSAPEAVVADTKRRRDEALMLVSKLDEQLKALD